MYDSFQNLRLHYKQAEAALKYGYTKNRADKTAGGKVTTYTECAAACLLQKCPSAALASFRWEILDDLLQYDRSHGSSYIKTLACYLYHERNLALTSKALFIHRNTLVYRINRLSRLLDCDLEDPAVRLRLTLCLELLRSQTSERQF